MAQFCRDHAPSSIVLRSVSLSVYRVSTVQLMMCAVSAWCGVDGDRRSGRDLPDSQIRRQHQHRRRHRSKNEHGVDHGKRPAQCRSTLCRMRSQPPAHRSRQQAREHCEITAPARNLKRLPTSVADQIVRVRHHFSGGHHHHTNRAAPYRRHLFLLKAQHACRRQFLAPNAPTAGASNANSTRWRNGSMRSPRTRTRSPK